jgi:hypothetical protein
MKTHVEEIPRWSTSSLGGAADPSPAELSTLTAQMDECKESRGRFFVLQCAVDTKKKKKKKNISLVPCCTLR